MKKKIYTRIISKSTLLKMGMILFLIFSFSRADAQGTILVEPLVIDFGDAPVGEQVTATITVSNIHPVDFLQIDSWNLAANHEFVILERPDIPLLLFPGESVQGVVGFTPSAIRPYFSSIEIYCTDLINYQVLVDLSGAGIEGNPPNEDLLPLMDAYIDALIEDGHLDNQGNGLSPKILSIQKSIEKGHYTVAIYKLYSFINKVNNLIANGHLTPEQGQPLIDYALSLIDYLNSLMNRGLRSSSSTFIFELGQNYPNPLTDETLITYSIPSEGHVLLQVYNANGLLIKTVVNGFMPPGNHYIIFEADNLPNGLYFYTIQFDDSRMTKRMSVLK